MNRTDLLIVDYKSSGLKRYAFDICKNLKAIDNNITIVASYIEEDYVIETPFIDNVISLKDYNFDAHDVIIKWQPKSVLLFAHRFIDYMFTIEAHRKGLIVLNFQHGIYMDSTVISSLSFVNLIKIFQKKASHFNVYLRCLFNIGGKSRIAFARTIISFVKYKNIYKVMNKTYGDICNADTSFIYGKYWIGYYKKQYIENNTDFVIVGYPELEAKNIEIPQSYIKYNDLPIVCYLCQTSVEDGIINKMDFNIFLKDLLSSLDDINLILKLHPRSNEMLYKPLLTSKYSSHVKIWKEKDFPKADAYIGHESTVIAHALALTDKVLIYRLKDDRISPFEKYTKYVSRANGKFHENLAQMIQAKNSSDNQALKDYVYWNKNFGAIQETSKQIYATLRIL